MRSFSVAISRPQAVAQHADALVFGRHFRARNAERLAHADDLVGGQRAGAQAALVAAAVHLRFQADARLAAHIQCADALGAVDLVGGEGHQVDLELVEVDGNLAGGLGRVHMEDHALAAADFAQLSDVLDHADFVVHEHDRGQDGVRADGRLELIDVEQAVGFRCKIGNLEALALQFAAGIEHGLVLGLHGDDVLALALVEVGGALDGQVVGFCGAGGPDDFLGIGIDQRGHLLARVFHRFFRFPAERVGTRSGVAEMFGEVGNHLFCDTGIHRGRGRVVEVDGEFQHVLLFLDALRLDCLKRGQPWLSIRGCRA